MPGNAQYFSSRTEDTGLLWRVLQSRMNALGLDLASLGRIQTSIRTRLGLEPPQYADPLQKPEFYIPGLAAAPWHDPARFEWVDRLERAQPDILREFLALQRRGALERRPEGRGGRWETCYLFFLGQKSDELCAQCPVTTAIVESIPGATAAGLVYFASLAPGTHLEPHCGPTNARLRCHLGLRVPDGCILRVGDDTRGWTEGKCIVFDDSFEHEVWHMGTETRSVLVLDIWHPELTRDETRAIAALLNSGARGLRQTALH